MELLSPTVDYIFKKIFESNKDLLVDLLNSILKYDICIKDLSYMSLKKMSVKEKDSILCVEAIKEDEQKINIEIQMKDTDDILKRSLYYWAKNYTGDSLENIVYSELKSVVYINILNYNLFKDDSIRHKFVLYDQKLKQQYNEDLEIYFIELDKVDIKKRTTKDKELLEWLSFIKAPNSTKVKRMSTINSKIDEAMNILKELSTDKEVREHYFNRRIALEEEANAIHKAKISGIQQGKQEVQEQIAISLLDILDDAIISEKTGLSIDRVKKLRN
ncbi:MAG: hypothetical protein BEN19_03115 [Epulopiscium sp. Nuni2H_MBin003]|nr:MAG: hypothetical protein BEN19_03115 [Epulopiscium sp. Nuni2H_MBin003]